MSSIVVEGIASTTLRGTVTLLVTLPVTLLQASV